MVPVDEEDEEAVGGAAIGIEGIELCRVSEEDEGPLTTSEDGGVDCFDGVKDDDNGDTDPAGPWTSTLLEVDDMVAAGIIEVARPAARRGSDVELGSRCISR